MVKFVRPVEPDSWFVRGFSRNPRHLGEDWGFRNLHPLRTKRVLAPARGRVVRLYTSATKNDRGDNQGWGNQVIIEHAPGVYSTLNHFAWGTIAVGLGQWVEAGDYVGRMGSTGSSTGDHLHHELRLGGIGAEYRVDPDPYYYKDLPGTAPAPAGGNAKPFPAPPQTPDTQPIPVLEEEEDDMPKNSGIYYESPKGSNTWIYVIFNYGSGLFHRFGNGAGAGKMPAAYNNALSTAFDTTSWAEVTEGHGKEIERSLSVAK